MDVLLLLPIGFVGSVLWIVSTEGSAMYYGSEGYHPLLVGVLAALGQALMYLVLFHGGEKLVGRWRWLADKVQLLRDRYQERLETGYLTLTGISSIIGLPPHVALMALGKAFGMRFWVLWPLSLAGRIVRFTVLAAAGDEIVAWWNSL